MESMTYLYLCTKAPATRSPGVGSQSCGAKYPGFCADSKGV